jgi:glycosyltransferase involved in cell wall biosynthesis
VKSSDNPKISIIVPVYNSAPYLKGCLDSLVNQSLRDIEIICINDASTDDSPQILDEYQAVDDRIQVITFTENRRQGSARNAGIRMAKGEYIAFVDSDDWVDNDMFEKLWQTAVNYGKADIAVSAKFYLNRQDIQLIMPSFPLEDFFNRKENFNQKIILKGYPIWASIYLKDFFLFYNLFFPEGFLFEDCIIPHAVYLLTTNIVIQNEALYHYVQHEKSTMHTISDSIFDILTTSGIFLEEMKRLGLYGRFKDECEYRYYCWCARLIVLCYIGFGSIRKDYLYKIKGIIEENIDLAHNKLFLSQKLDNASIELSMNRYGFSMLISIDKILRMTLNSVEQTCRWFAFIKIINPILLFIEKCYFLFGGMVRRILGKLYKKSRPVSEKRIKYSLIVPVKNSAKYLLQCVNSIISQDYSDYELIISDDHSTDGTVDLLKTFQDSKIKIIYPHKNMTVIEHFDFAIRHAKGEWIMTLGGDDGLQPYFFKAADVLTRIAESKGIRAIASKRAYYYWEGCQEITKLNACYAADFGKSYRIRRSNIEMLKVLLGLKGEENYHALPTMYTTSLFHYSLVDEIRGKQGGKIFTFNFPDVNLAALGISMERRYIESAIPLGWVGTSPLSIRRDVNVINQIRKIPERCGDFNLGSCSIYLWGSLTAMPDIRDKRRNRLITSKVFISLMLGGILFSLKKNNEYQKKRKMLWDVININNCSMQMVKFFSFIFVLCNLMHSLCISLVKIYKTITPMRLCRKFVPKNNFIAKIIWVNDNSYLSMTEASEIIMNMTKNKFN